MKCFAPLQSSQIRNSVIMGWRNFYTTHRDTANPEGYQHRLPYIHDSSKSPWQHVGVRRHCTGASGGPSIMRTIVDSVLHSTAPVSMSTKPITGPIAVTILPHYESLSQIIVTHCAQQPSGSCLLVCPMFRILTVYCTWKWWERERSKAYGFMQLRLCFNETKKLWLGLIVGSLA